MGAIMNEQEKFDRFIDRYPHHHKFIAERPHLSRRDFFQLAGAGVTLGMLAPASARAQGVKIVTQPVTMQNKAKYCIFVLMAGAPKPHRYVRLEDGERNHARHLHAGNGERRLLAHRTDAEARHASQ